MRKNIRALLISFIVITSFNFLNAQLPAGPYQQSCYNCSIADNKLSCLCHTAGGYDPGYNYTSNLKLNPELADQPINNCNGHLVYGSCAPLPLGSYQESCDGCFVKDNILECISCISNKSMANYAQPASLKLDKVGPAKPISNCKGKLKYGRC
ncbi:MAG TPA: hypothetical protein VHA52_06430 [Candidatus Babeliaceae bacterium]|nr:hypothetical protein [Candidatus Babeliaceae bacterium]